MYNVVLGLHRTTEHVGSICGSWATLYTVQRDPSDIVSRLAYHDLELGQGEFRQKIPGSCRNRIVPASFID